MAARRRSVPASTPSCNELTSSGEVVLPVMYASASAPTSTPSPVPSQNSKLVVHADALARMTFELSLRNVCGQAERLERDVKALVMCTQQDKDFQQENTKRLGSLMKEIFSVKIQMKKAEAGQDAAKVDHEKLQRELVETRDQFKKEMVDVKTIVEGLLTQLDQFPAAEDAHEEVRPRPPSPPRMETRAMLRAKMQRANEALDRTGKLFLARPSLNVS